MLFSLRTKNYFRAWIFIEINLVRFICVLNINKCKFQSLVRIKYFIIQRGVSLIILVILACTQIVPQNFNLVLVLLFLVKLGAAPFHAWFIRITLKINWFNLFWASTFQKMIPLIMITYLRNFSIINILILGAGVSRIAAFFQYNLKKILAYSSVFRLNWIIARLFFREIFWLKFLIIYGALKLSVILINFNLIATSNKFNLRVRKLSLKILMVIRFLAIIGVPPFPIFFLKILIVKKMLIIFRGLTARLLVSSVALIFMYLSFSIKILTNSSQLIFTRSMYYTKWLTVSTNALSIFASWSFILLLQKNQEFWFLNS